MSEFREQRSMASGEQPLGKPPDGPVGPGGEIRVGRYAGALDAVRWGYPTGWLHGQVRRAMGRKRWFQAGVFAGNLVVVVRLVDHGLAGSGLVWVAELDTGKTVLEHRIPGIPLANLAVGPMAGRGAEAHVTLPLARIRLAREPSSSAWELTAHWPGNAISLSLDTRAAPTPMLLVGEPSPGNGVLTQRFVGLEARGTVRVRSELLSLETRGVPGVGFLEYGNGFFPRPLMWSTAMVVGSEAAPWTFASDLSTFGDEGESAVWLDGEPRPLGPARLTAPDGREPWTVDTADRRLGVSFQPRAVCSEQFGQGSTAMRHVLVAGRFEGNVPTANGVVHVSAPGLCEARSFG